MHTVQRFSRPEMPTVAVMAGTGSDDDYLRRSFGPAVAARGGELRALRPEPALVETYLAELDALAARGTPLLVGGVSIGAVVALSWALRQPPGGPCRGVLAVLPPWSGAPDDSPAAMSAQLTATAIEEQGLESAIAAMTAGSPDWLGAELGRSWRALADRDLPGQLRQAATLEAPTPQQISALIVPLAVVACPDDPLHPIAVARRWAAAAPRAVLSEVGLQEWGRHPRILGEAALTGWSAIGDAAEADPPPAPPPAPAPRADRSPRDDR